MFTVLNLQKTNTEPKTFQGSPKVFADYLDARAFAESLAATKNENNYYILQVRDKVYQKPTPVVVESVSLS